MLIKMNPDSLWSLESLSDRDLSNRCQRALFASARAHWRGSRAGLQRRVRSFLRRSSHDRAAMYSILRGVAASSLFAILLMGIDVKPAHAALAEFTLTTTPTGAIDAGANSTPAFADLDGDGDQDLLSGESYGKFRYYENTGSAVNPSFTARLGAANPLNGEDVGYYSTPTFADLDADGDQDLIAGELYGAFRYYENTGSAMSPVFTARTGASNPLDALSVITYSTPVFSDLDGDGDLDLVSGDAAGGLSYFENIGSAAVPSFVARTGLANPFNGLTAGSYSAPALSDLDGDGDFDLVAGNFDGAFAYFENIGSTSSAAFIERTGAANPVNGIDIGYNATPTFVDIDNDGDLDIMAGEYDAIFRFVQNTTPPVNLIFDELIGGANPLNGFAVASSYSAPVLADLDNDGDLDMVSGSYGGTFSYFENIGSNLNPAFIERTGVANPLDGFLISSYYVTPTLADIDGDGDLDMVAGSYNGAFFYFENTGTPASPAFTQRTGPANPLDGLSAGYFSAPTLVDLDGDGDFDLVSGEGQYNGIFLYYENTGSVANPNFIERTGAANPLDAFAVGGYSTPSFADFDGDGDLDLASGDDAGTFLYFENTGSPLSPAFTQRASTTNPFFALSTTGTGSKPVLADLDGDGDLELVAGSSAGSFNYFENVNPPTAAPVPFGGFWVRVLASVGILGAALAHFRHARRRLFAAS